MAPKTTADKGQHRLHAHDVLADDRYKEEPTDRPVGTDLPPEANAADTEVVLEPGETVTITAPEG